MKAMASEGANTQYPIWIGQDNLLYSDLSRLEDHLMQLLSYTESKKTAEYAKIIQTFLNKQHIVGKPVRLSMHGFPKLLTWIILRSMCAKDIQILCSDSANKENSDNIKEAISTEQWYELLQIKDGSGKTPLHWAAYRDSTEMVIQLLHDMSDDQKWELLRSKNMYGKTPLHEAVYQHHPQMVRVLLGFFPTANCPRLRRLLQDRDSSGKTLLIWAAQQGHTETVQVMLNAIVKSNLQGRLLAMTDDDGQTILHCAACEGHTEVLRSIKGFLKPDEWHKLVKKQDCSGFSTLLSGVSQGHVRIAELIKELVSAAVWLELLNMKDSTGTTCLLWAAWRGDTELIKLFLKSLSSDQWYQVLHEQFMYIGWTVLHRAVWLGKKEVVQLIHESLSADPDLWCQLLQKRDKSGRTALHLAVWKSSTDLMWFINHTLEEEQWISLLQAKDGNGFTALYMAGYRHMVPSKDETQTELRRTMVLSLKKTVNDPKVWDNLVSARTPSARQLKGIANKEVYLKAIESLKDFGETVSRMEKEDYEDPATYKPDDMPSTPEILKRESEDNAADLSKTTLLESESSKSADERSNFVSTPDYEKLVQALTNAAARVPIDLSISNQQVQLNRIQDSIFREVREFGANKSHEDSGKTMSCILITRIVSNCGEGHSHRFESDNMLIVVQGDISISHHFFNRGKEISWQISGMKCWNEHLREVLNEVQTPESIQNSRFPPLMVASVASDHDSIPSTIQCSVHGILCSYRSGSINFLLESDNDELTAKFQLLHNGIKINEVVSCFEDYQSSSECSDAHHILELVDQLDVDEDERPVTVVVMAACTEYGLSKYLLQLIAGHLKEPMVRPTDEFWKEIQTHYVGNDSLYEEIVRRCDEGLENLKPDKKEKLVSEGASFVVTSSFPVVDIDGEFKITGVIPATIEISQESQEVYTFQTEETLFFRLYEPSSPPKWGGSNGGATASSTFDVQPENLLAKLHEAHYKMFTQLRKFHETDAGMMNAVSAITSVARLADGSTQDTLFLLKGIWYGSGIEDRMYSKGWRVSVIPLLSSKLTAQFESDGQMIEICSGTEPKLVDANNLAKVVHNGIRLSIQGGSDHNGTVKITSDHAKCPEPVTFTHADTSRISGIQLELIETITTELLNQEVYEQKYEDEGRMKKASDGKKPNEEVGVKEREEKENDVMISVHVVKTMLKKTERKKKNKKKSGLPHRINLSSGLQITKIIILAIGKSDQLCIPREFCYHDPLNCWRSQSHFVKSSILKAAVEKHWEDFKNSTLNVPESVAKHIMLNGILEEVPLSVCRGKVRYGDGSEGELLEYLSHAPDRNSLDHVLKESDRYQKDRELWQSARDDETSHSTFLRIKSNFFDEKRLPTSYKYDTIKIKHNILPRPNQQGANCSPSLHLHYHDEAHIKFTELVEPAQKFDDEAIKKKLKIDEN